MRGRVRAAANLATLANAVLGVGAILYILAGNKLWAMALIMAGIAFDGLDGILSRRAGGPPSRFGRYADSVADAITFGVAPATLIAIHSDRPVLWTAYAPATVLIAALLVALAFARLTYFTIRAYDLPYFLGAPTPQTALGVVVLILFCDVPAFVGTNPVFVLVGAGIAALLMVVPIPFPKMRTQRVLRYVTLLTSLGLAASLVLLQFRPAVGSVSYGVAFVGAAVGAAGVVAYYLVGPFVVHRTPPAAEVAHAET
ncbi:MAG: CDP-alcohol phosphatidyltransferase family protein [Thermoplasmata archaeon]